MEVNLWSDEQKSHQAIVKDKVALQTEVPKLLGINCGKCGRWMERKKRAVPREVSSADGNRVRNPSVTTNGEKSAEVIVPLWLQT